MIGVLDGFAVIAVVIACGYLLAMRGVLDEAGGRALAAVVFHVAMPCLLFSLLQKSDLGQVFSGGMLVSVGSVVISAGTFLALTARCPQELGDRVIGALSSCYVNAGNLGVPIAVFVLGGGAEIAPVLLIQLLVLAPIAFAVLDLHLTGARPSALRLLRQPFKNPITIGTFLGVVVASTGSALPQAASASISLLGGLAVPGALLAYGVALRTGPKPLVDVDVVPVSVATVCKLLVQPCAAFVLAHLGGLDAHGVLACTVLAALPTAQNVFVYASTYRTATVLARDVVFLTTLASLPVILLVAACLR